jgi:hypothetical protein
LQRFPLQHNFTVRPRPDGAATDLVAQLIGAKERVVASAPLFALRNLGHRCGCGNGEPDAPRYPFAFQAFVTDVERGAVLVIWNGEKELLTRRAPETEPEVTSVRARVTRDTLSLTWRAKHTSGGEPETWAQLSTDDAKTWGSLATGLQGHEAAFDISHLPSGVGEIRLLVSDGFHTTVSKPVTVQIPMLPMRAPDVNIFTPCNGQTFEVRQTLRIWGAATRSSGSYPLFQDHRGAAQRTGTRITLIRGGIHDQAR